MRILVDVDSTVADMVPAWLERYNAEFDDHLTAEDILSWDIVKYLKPECGSKIYSYLSDPTLYEQVQPYDGALYTLREFRTRGHEILFTSAGILGAPAKYRWLLDWGFITTKDNSESEYIAIFRKDILVADGIIDDRPSNVTATDRRFRVLMNRPHNLTYQLPPRLNIKRADSWQKVLNLMDLLELGYE